MAGYVVLLLWYFALEWAHNKGWPTRILVTLIGVLLLVCVDQAADRERQRKLHEKQYARRTPPVLPTKDAKPAK